MIVAFAIVNVLIRLNAAVSIDLRNCKIWGPGLSPSDIVMPARYFFVDTNINNLSLSDESYTDDVPFQVFIEGKTQLHNGPCRIWQNVLDRKDGSYIVRYKVYETCYNVQIALKHNNEHIGDSPYRIQNVVLPDNCYCPLNDVNRWMDLWQCGEVPQQILADLKRFVDVDFGSTRKKIITKFNNPSSNSLCHYAISNNKIYRTCYGKYVGFKMFMDSILLSLTRKVKLPDVEMFINLGDWPLIKKDSVRDEIFPIFSWCGSDDTHDIVMPTYDITEATLENMGRVMLDMLSVQGNLNLPWKQRIPKIFWRGRDSNRHRLDLIDISRKHPHLFNVSLTNFFFFRDEEKIYGPKAEHVSLFRFFDYKYQLNIDGTVAAYRMPYLLAGASLLFKQDSKYYEHFYKSLVPFVHFIPVKTDLSDLIDRLDWAVNNDKGAMDIALEGQRFARDNLMPVDVFCYYGHLLNEWKKRLTSDVVVLDDMELVEQPDSKSLACDCDRLKNNRDEL